MCIRYQEYTSQLKQKPPKDVLKGVFLSLDSKASGIWMELHFSPKRKGRSDIFTCHPEIQNDLQRQWPLEV